MGECCVIPVLEAGASKIADRFEAWCLAGWFALLQVKMGMVGSVDWNYVFVGKYVVLR